MSIISDTVFLFFFPATASSLLETHTPNLACRTTKTTLHCKYFFSFQHVRPLSCKKYFRGSVLKKGIFIGKLQLCFDLKPSPFSHFDKKYEVCQSFLVKKFTKPLLTGVNGHFKCVDLHQANYTTEYSG